MKIDKNDKITIKAQLLRSMSAKLEWEKGSEWGEGSEWGKGSE